VLTVQERAGGEFDGGPPDVPGRHDEPAEFRQRDRLCAGRGGAGPGRAQDDQFCGGGVPSPEETGSQQRREGNTSIWRRWCRPPACGSRPAAEL
jgi:hypothetical protein